MFSFSYDAGKNLLTVIQTGYWSMSVFLDYRLEYLAWHEKILRSQDSYRVFADCSAYPVQAAEIGEAYIELFAKLMSENKGRCAIRAASTLNKMQAKRAIPQPNVQVFSEEEEAMAWLCEDGK